MNMISKIQSCLFYGYIDPINKKKPMGFLNALSKKFTLTHNNGNYGCSLNTGQDFVFGEILDNSCDFSKNKYVCTWTTRNIKEFISLGEKFPNTIFLMAPKTNFLDIDNNNQYIKKFGYWYQRSGDEGINIYDVNSFIDKNYIMDKNYCRLSKNTYLTYLPCCLSEDEASFNENRDYDLIYVGTTHNRKNVNAAINYFKTKYNVFSTTTNGPISPEEAVEKYSRSKVAISEQVHPVVMEHPVRLGETRRRGCSYVTFSDFVLPSKTCLIPDINQTNNFDEYINIIENKIKKFNLNPYISNTYDNAINFILKIFDEVIKQ